MKFAKHIILILFFGLAQLGYGQSQEGTIRGKVIDASSGEPLIGVNVLVVGTSQGASTDVDGAFNLEVGSGTHNLRLSYISYQNKTVEGIEVKAGDITVLDNIALSTATTEMQEVVVTAGAVRNSEAAMLTMKRTSPKMLDGISSEKFDKIGVSDAAEALKKVTGVSVEGGKYVYVRGLGDRYTNTMLNSVEIPSLDPNRNSLQVDIFPSNLIENMVINKTASADLPADFTGGIVNIETVDFPDRPILDISTSFTYNPDMHFNSKYLTYNGSSTDFLGFDDGVRKLPNNAREENIPSPLNGAPDSEVNDFINSFNSTLGPKQESNNADYSVGLTWGDQYTVGNDNTLGYIISGKYSNTTKYYNNFEYGEWQNALDAENFDLVRSTTQNGIVAENNVLLGGVAGVAYKNGRSKFKLTGMRLQNGESRSANFKIDNSESAPGQSGYIGESYNLAYSERSITNFLLNGTHYFDKTDWEVDWRVSPTFSTMNDPDLRRTTFTIRSNGDYIFNAGAGGFPSRTWRYMDEMNLVSRVNVTGNYSLFGNPAKVKFGGSHVYKQRDYEILSYNVSFFGTQPEWKGNPSEVLTDDHIYGNGNGGTIYYQSGNADPNPNAYNSNASNTAFYVSNEFSLIPNVKTNFGLRVENFVLRHTGRDISYAQGNTEAGINFDDQKVLDALDFFPSANVIYNISNKTNVRASYSRTIARPSFKEMSFAQIIDPISNRIFNGGLYSIGSWDGNLHETRINNFDFRFETFLNGNQLISLSTFYKTFDDPIELVRLRASATSSEFQPRNVGNGEVYGAEFELRKSFNFLSESLTNFGFSTNVTLVKSLIDMTDEEFNARKNREKQGQNIDDQRQMAGQAPYIINAGLTYDNADLNMDAGLFYNLKGKTLVLVGGGTYPDVYTEPFHNLNFNLNKSFGQQSQYSLSVNVSNILNDRREEFYHGYNTADKIYEGYSPGRTYSIGFKYSF